MKYKLIKEYPNSPVLGTVVYQEMPNGDYCEEIDISHLYNSDGIENFPDFWQPVDDIIDRRKLSNFPRSLTKNNEHQ
jgi:hypothetical protein